MRILIAEDEDALREELVRVMHRAGHDVTEAVNAEEALLAFRQNPFPLVVTDIVMGRMSGLDLLREIRRQDDEAMVVVMTSHASLETATAAVRAGAYDLFIKPFEDLSVIHAMLWRAEDRVRLLEENRKLRQGLGPSAAADTSLDGALAATLVRDRSTGLYLESYFREALEIEVARCRRHKRMFSLVLVAGTGSSSGEPCADERYLRAAASILASRGRTTDVVARYGTGGFAVILPETDTPGAERFAELLRHKLAAARACDPDTFPADAAHLATAVATFPRDGDAADRLLEFAGKALGLAMADAALAPQVPDSAAVRQE